MSLAGADVSPFSEERHSLLQRHGHLLPLHLAADAVRDVLPRVPPQVDIHCTYCGWCRYLQYVLLVVRVWNQENLKTGHARASSLSIWIDTNSVMNQKTAICTLSITFHHLLFRPVQISNVPDVELNVTVT